MATEGTSDLEDSDDTSLKQRLAEQEIIKSAGLDSSSQTSLARVEPKVVLINGIGKGDGHFESGALPNDGKLPAIDAPESQRVDVPKIERSFSRQNSDRGGTGEGTGGGGGGGGGVVNGEKGVVVEGQTGEVKQEANEIQVSWLSSSFLPLSH